MIKISNKDRVKAFVLIVFIVVIFCAILFFTMPNSCEIMTHVNTKMIIDGTKISKGMYNYFYCSVTNSATLTNLSLIENIDENIPLEEQYYDIENGITWKAFLEASAIDQISRIVYLNNRGEEIGLELFEEQKLKIDDQLSEIKRCAKESGLTVNDYTSIIYGEYVGIKTIEKILYMSFMAQNYYEYYCTQSKLSDMEILEYFNLNTADVCVVSFSYYIINYDEQTFKESKRKAENILKSLKKNDDFFSALYENDVLSENLTMHTTLLNKNIRECNFLSQKTIDWIYDISRKSKDKTMILDEVNKRFIIIDMITPMSDNYEKRYSMREILIEYESQTEKNNKSDEIIKRIKSAEHPEYCFAVLADIYNKADQNQMAGGMVTGIAPESLNDELKDWLTNASRVHGDIISIEGNKGIYIYYYIGISENWKSKIHHHMLNIEIKKMVDDVIVN